MKKQLVKDDLKYETSQNSDGCIDKSTTNSPESKAHLHKRRSVLKETSTSRYRSFVEKNICQIGLNGLSQRIKLALHKTLWKTRQALEVNIITCKIILITCDATEEKYFLFKI